MKFEIKPVESGEVGNYVDHIIKFCRDNGRDGVYFSPTPADYERDREKMKNDFKDRIEKPFGEQNSEKAFCAVVDDQIIGNIDLRVYGHQSATHRVDLGMGLQYAFKGQGLGSALLKTGIDFLKDHGQVEYIDLGVFHNNQAAISLYKKFGFKEVGRLDDHFRCQGVRLDEILMTLNLRL